MAENRPESEAVPPPIPSDELLHGRKEILLEHNGETYWLWVSEDGKLMLTPQVTQSPPARTPGFHPI